MEPCCVAVARTGLHRHQQQHTAGLHFRIAASSWHSAVCELAACPNRCWFPVHPSHIWPPRLCHSGSVCTTSRREGQFGHSCRIVQPCWQEVCLSFHVNHCIILAGDTQVHDLCSSSSSSSSNRVHVLPAQALVVCLLSEVCTRLECRPKIALRPQSWSGCHSAQSHYSLFGLSCVCQWPSPHV